MLNIYIANLGKYNEGELAGDWLELPSTREEYLDLLARIQIDGHRYEEVAIHDYDSDTISTSGFGEYESIDELNYLAAQLDALDPDDLTKIGVLTEWETTTPAETLQLLAAIDDCELIPDISSDYDLGYYYVEDSGIYDTSKLGPLAYHINYESLGRDIRISEAGTFTNRGYLGHYEYGSYFPADIGTEYIITRDPEAPKTPTGPTPLDLVAAAYPSPVAANPNKASYQPEVNPTPDELGKSEEMQR